MSAEATVCYHCGLPVAADGVYQLSIFGEPRQMCCAGCLAVAQAIVDNNLLEYYRHRDAMPASPRQALPSALDELGLFDAPDMQRDLVRAVGDDEREVELILEGITCAACVWLNERHLAQLPGITAVQVNYATHRARVRWRPQTLNLSHILQAVEHIGYHAYPFDPARAETQAAAERRTALWRLFVAGFGMMQVMMYAWPAYSAGEGDLSPAAAQIMRWASLILTLPVVLYSAAPFFQRAWRDLRLRRLGMDVPVALGVGSAFLASLWATVSGQGEVYFDSVSMFVCFLLAGRYLELLARQRAVRGVESINRLLPTFARRIAADGSESRVALQALREGDHLRVLPGEGVMADGVVLEGSSLLTEAWLTGESRAVAKSSGDVVLAGSVNQESALLIRADKIGEATRLSVIRRLMEQAAAERPRIVEQADRIARHFVLILLILACASAVYWWQTAPEEAFRIFVSVLVVSCPCALSLATPAALTVATESFGRHGLLITRSHVVETLARVDQFVFDKTGTLTEGRASMSQLRLQDGLQAQEVLAWASALEQHASHPLARAFIEASPPQAAVQAQAVRSVTGQGVQGRIGAIEYALGRAQFVEQLAACAPPAAWQEDGADTHVFLARQGAWLARFSFQDKLRADAPAALAALAAAHCRLSIMSGDAAAPVRAVAAALGVDDARANMLPEDKHAAVAALQADGRVLAMVGDGVNDAPVLAQAHVSIAMAGGAELARGQADVLLLDNALRRLPLARRIAQRSLAVIRQNLFWAASYNLLSVPAAMAGWVTPWMAGLGMGLSSLLVVLNALRIRRVK